MAQRHAYDIVVTWTGNRGTGTSGYRDYDRDHDVAAAGLVTIAGSSDAVFRGDPTRWNPEQLLVASLSQCHMLWYLHLCAQAGIVVTDYVDHAVGSMESTDDGGRFVEVVLRPQVEVVASATVASAVRLHVEARRACFIANSVNFPVRHEPNVRSSGSDITLRLH
jgi:organic hydroperoxide reductase OsmC/OhrA